LPPLRDRREDIPGIAKVLLERIGRDWSGHWTLSREAERRLCAYNFPGNVRELRNILQKAAALADGPIIEAKHLEFFHPATPESSAMPSVPAARPRPAPGRGQCPADLLDLLERFQGNRRQVAEYLGVSERSVYRWLKRLDRD
ncbi:AAA family ATPase, partial [Acidithiobacillus caldus]